MKLLKLSFAFFATLFLLISCASTSNSGLEQRNEVFSIQIIASKLDVFDATSQVFMNKGFSITSTNERLGLITTDYKDIRKSVGNSVFSGLFGKEDMQIMLSTNIRSAETGCLLNILPKGRAKKSKKKDYVEITFSEEFIKIIATIGQEIKILAENNSNEIAKEQPQTRNDAPDAKKTVPYSNFKVRITASKANIRIKPNLQSEILSSVPLGAILEVQNKEGDWYLVKLPNSQDGFNVTGYIHQSIVEEYR